MVVGDGLALNHWIWIVDVQAAKTGFVILLMSIYWIGSVLPLAVTSLIPIALLPMLNVMSTDAVCGCYFNESNVVFFCGVILAIGVEQSQLHQRIALRILILFGTNPKWLVVPTCYNQHNSAAMNDFFYVSMKGWCWRSWQWACHCQCGLPIRPWLLCWFP